MPSRARDWRAPVGLLGLALAALIALAIVEAEVEPPGGGCFGQPAWANGVAYSLAPLSVLAASASAAAFGVRLRWSMIMCAAFALSMAVLWILVLVLTVIAVEGSC